MRGAESFTPSSFQLRAAIALTRVSASLRWIRQIVMNAPKEYSRSWGKTVRGISPLNQLMLRQW